LLERAKQVVAVQAFVLSNPYLLISLI